MSHIIDELVVLDCYFDGDKFILRGINGQAIYGGYKAENMLSLARLIHDNEPFSFTIDKEKMIRIPVELNRRIKHELNMIANELSS
ncbi:hypothetical protein [Niallia circulans]|uniref:Uncharacterized protein n=1 Tax=Niallia circulans TaxID=1397 RepID=A0A941GJJ8_NIACI|nr:hypothetical protein [Niallia circulans]MCB5236871.1 hypothetical protein [Niallia circulans]